MFPFQVPASRRLALSTLVAAAFAFAVFASIVWRDGWLRIVREPLRMFGPIGVTLVVAPLVFGGIAFQIRRRAAKKLTVMLVSSFVLAVAAFLAAIEAYVAFARMAGWTDWYLLISSEYSFLLAASLAAPLLIGAGSLLSLSATPLSRVMTTFRIVFLASALMLLFAWTWYFERLRVIGDVGPDYVALHWPQNGALPFPVRFLWSGWGLLWLIVVALLLLLPPFIHAVRPPSNTASLAPAAGDPVETTI